MLTWLLFVAVFAGSMSFVLLIGALMCRPRRPAPPPDVQRTRPATALEAFQLVSSLTAPEPIDKA